jgi:hypothetical protein
VEHIATRHTAHRQYDPHIRLLPYEAITEEFATTSNTTLTTRESDINVFRLKNHIKNFIDILNNTK